MNTKGLAVLLLGTLLLSCSSPEDSPADPAVDAGVDTQYTFLLGKQGRFSSMEFDANAIQIKPGSDGITQLPLESPEITYRDGSSFSFLRALPDCSAEIRYLGPSGSVVSLDGIFGDDPNCERQLLSLTHSENKVFIGYSLPGTEIKEVVYYINAFSLDKDAPPLGEIALENEPLQLAWSGNRLYVLTYDIETGKYALEAYGSSGNPEGKQDLGTGVLKILKNPAGQLLISYQTSHLLVDAASMEVIGRVLYEEGKDPGFGNSGSNFFDPSGVLYYAMPTNFSNTSFAHIAGIYDFSKYTAYLYYFENFLSGELIAQYGIGDTRSVAFDQHNGLLLIGYEKAGTEGEGGLLRVKPVPEPKFIDQIDLEGVPMHLIVH